MVPIFWLPSIVLLSYKTTYLRFRLFGGQSSKSKTSAPLNAFELYRTPLMPLWPLTPITGNKVYSSPNQDMHERDRSLIPSHPETAVSRAEGGCLKVWEGMTAKTGLEVKSQSMVTPQKRNQDIVYLCSWFKSRRRDCCSFCLCMACKA